MSESTDIAYFALVPMKIGKDPKTGERLYAEPGELVLHLTNDRSATSAVRLGQVAPVLVSTLPSDQQKVVREHLEARAKEQESAQEAAGAPESDENGSDGEEGQNAADDAQNGSEGGSEGQSNTRGRSNKRR